MGTPKALLPLGGRRFLDRLVDTLRAGGCDPVVVVAGPRTDPTVAQIAALAGAHGATVLHNPRGDAEQIDSLRLGLRSLPAAAEAAVVTPVDAPGIAPRVVAALIERWRCARAPIVLPVFQGQRGHPVVFARAVWPELLAPSLPEGARSVIQADAARLALVTVDDAAVLQDVDTPADYQRLRRGYG